VNSMKFFKNLFENPSVINSIKSAKSNRMFIDKKFQNIHLKILHLLVS